MVDLNELLIFVKVIQAGSFTAAARRLGIPKTTVSRKLAELEERLGARLLHRTTRRIRLTEQGETYYGRCAHVIAEIEEANLALATLQQAPRGVLRLAAPISFGNAVLVDWVSDFLRDNPQVDVQVLLSNQYVDLVDEGIDLAFRVGPLKDSALVARKLGTVQYLVCASPAYVAARGEPKLPQDLARHDCVLLSVREGGNKWIFAGPAGAEEVEVSGRLKVNDVALCRAATVAGTGIAYMPSFVVARDIAEGRLQHLLKAWSPPSRDMFAVYPSNRFLSPKVRAFVDYAVREFGSL